MPTVEGCRTAAASCLELAKLTADPETKQVLMVMAQEWLKAAYAHQNVHLEHVLAEFNQQQLRFDAGGEQQTRSRGFPSRTPR